MDARTRVLFLIPSLVAHGAERQLCELVKAMDASRFELHVAVFYDPEQVEGADLTPELEALPHVTLHSLRKRRGALGNLTLLPRLLALASRLRPHILHGYMDGNLPALVVGRLLGSKVVWGIRRSNADLKGADARSLAVLRWLVRLSRFTHLILFNSEAGLETHRVLGMKAPRMAVVPNGFDTVRFTPDPEAGRRYRAELGIPETAPLIGIVGRLNPVKGHALFIEAAAQVAQKHPEAWFVCIGDGSRDYAQAMRQQAEARGLGARMLWPGASSQMPSAYNALTLVALASLEEGFPNVLGEAMACGVPCASVKVGDAEVLIGPTGKITETRDSGALAAALCDLLEENPEARASRARSCRERVVRSYGTDVLARHTEHALLALLPLPTPRPHPAEK